MNRQQRRAAARQARPSETAGAQLAAEAMRHHQAGRLDQASALYLRALAARPNDAEVLARLGGLRLQQCNYAEAVELISKAIAVEGNFPSAYSNLASALAELGRLDEAVEACRRAIALKPDFAPAHSNLGAVLRKLGRHTEAEKSLREALRLQPKTPAVHYNLGLVLDELGRPAEAESHLQEALRRQPNAPEVNFGLGVVLRQLGRAAEAATFLREALRHRPDDPETHFNLACALLLAGELEEGWEAYEWRWKTKLSQRARDFPAPLWRGESIGDRVILLHAEQGLGDTLQFCRFAPLIAAGGARVVLEVPRSLVRLLWRLPGAVEIVARGDPLPSFDLHCPLLSLPRATSTRLDAIPAEVPYLQADPALAAAWRERLADLSGLRVGLVWAGQRPEELRMASVDARRSVSLGALAPLGEVTGVSFVSLQKGAPAKQALSPPAGMALHDFTAELDDFADTAALVDGLDLVISVDTSVAHLAGGLGKPVWLLNRYDTDWRWLLGRDDSPWYPSLRQFRQPSPLDWTSVIAEVRDALARLAAGDRDQLRPRSAKQAPN